MNGTVGIAGLGLIGGSLAKAVKARTDCRVLGHDISPKTVSKAIEQGAIDGELTESGLGGCGLVIIALYPGDVISYCERNLQYMQSGTVAVDCAGVKTRICGALSAKMNARGIRFVGGHPMAGAERSGFESSSAGLFGGATMILCEDGHTDQSALSRLGAFFLSLGFGNIKITCAREHDEVIAYTSQLAHIVSGAYIRGEARERRYGFSAGSFKDLTRVARLNDEMWGELFFENRENLLKEADAFLGHVRAYRDALAGNDAAAMKRLLQSGTALKLADEEGEREWLGK